MPFTDIDNNSFNFYKLTYVGGLEGFIEAEGFLELAALQSVTKPIFSGKPQVYITTRFVGKEGLLE